jgi:hypothetical protein
MFFVVVLDELLSVLTVVYKFTTQIMKLKLSLSNNIFLSAFGFAQDFETGVYKTGSTIQARQCSNKKGNTNRHLSFGFDSGFKGLYLGSTVVFSYSGFENLSF